MKKVSTESIVLIVITLAGWAFTAGTIQGHLEETKLRLDHIERQIDVIVENQKTQ